MKEGILSVRRLQTRIELFADFARDEAIKEIALSRRWTLFPNPDTLQKEAIQAMYNSYLSYEQMISHLIFWVYKDYYIDTLPRKSIGESNLFRRVTAGHIEDPETLRRKFDRAMKAMITRVQTDSERLGTSAEYIDLVATKDKMPGDRSKIYHLTDYDIKAVENYFQSGLRIIQILENGAVAQSANGITGEEISNAYREYFTYLQGENDTTDSKDWILALLNVSSIESNLGPSFLYAVAKYMDEHDERDVPDEIDILMKMVPIGSLGTGRVQSMFLHDRNRSIERFFRNVKDNRASQLVELQFYTLLEIQAFVRHVAKNDPETKELLSHISPNDAKDYFKEHYDLFADSNFVEWKSPDNWSPSLVKRYRSVVRKFSQQAQKKGAEKVSKAKEKKGRLK